MSLIGLSRLFGDRPLYMVGGAVRNKLLGVPAHDIDITAGVRAEEVISMLEGTSFIVEPSSLRMGTLIIRDGDAKYEYTAFRCDSYREGSGEHSPIEVKFTSDIELDARRRDFRVNAIYYDILHKKYVDPLGGISDVEHRLLRTTRSAEEVFSEDGLRLLRLVRFYAETGFSIDEECYRVASRLVHLLKDISVERIADEFNKILLADTSVYGNSEGHYKGVRLLIDMDAMEYIFPELMLGDGVMQNPKYHKDDVLSHILHAFRLSHPSVRLATLLHDIGKPVEQSRVGNMYNHPETGAVMAQKALLRLKYPNRVIDEVTRLIRVHMFDHDNMAKRNTIIRFILANHDIMDKFLYLRYADSMGGNGDTSSYYTIKEIYDKMIDNEIPMSVRDLAIDGNDLIAVGMAGKDIGEALDRLLYEVAIGNIPADRPSLLEHIRGTR